MLYDIIRYIRVGPRTVTSRFTSWTFTPKHLPSGPIYCLPANHLSPHMCPYTQYYCYHHHSFLLSSTLFSYYRIYLLKLVSGNQMTIVKETISHCVKSVHISSFSGPYFPAYGDMQSIFGYRCGKIRTRKTPNMNTFHALQLTWNRWK